MMEKKIIKFTPQAYTLIYWLIEDKKINSNMLFDFLELFWPTFIQKDDYVFLKEKFSEEEYNRLIADKINPEFWINFLSVDDFFFNDDDKEKNSIVFCQILTEIWKTKLKKDFPSFDFTIKCLNDSQTEDHGLTFYQTKNDS